MTDSSSNQPATPSTTVEATPDSAISTSHTQHSQTLYSSLDDKKISWIGIALVVIGTLFFFNSINMGFLVWRFLPPVLLVGIGIHRIRRNKDAKDEQSGRILMLIGAMIFIFTSGLIRIVGALLPIGLIAGGIYLLNRERFNETKWAKIGWVKRLTGGMQKVWQDISGQSHTLNNISDNQVSKTSWVIFGKNRKKIIDVEDNIQSRSIFGEMELDLRPLESKIPKGDIYIDTQTVFAETRVIIPSSWKVNVNKVAILGEVSDRTNGNTEGNVTAHMEGTTIFGKTHITN